MKFKKYKDIYICVYEYVIISLLQFAQTCVLLIIIQMIN